MRRKRRTHSVMPFCRGARGRQGCSRPPRVSWRVHAVCERALAMPQNMSLPRCEKRRCQSPVYLTAGTGAVASHGPLPRSGRHDDPGAIGKFARRNLRIETREYAVGTNALACTDCFTSIARRRRIVPAGPWLTPVSRPARAQPDLRHTRRLPGRGPPSTLRCQCRAVRRSHGIRRRRALVEICGFGHVDEARTSLVRKCHE